MFRITFSLFLLGLSFGSGPCIASCGPILLSYIAGTQKNTLKGILVYFLFSLARTFAYVVLGLLIFFLGRVLTERWLGALYKYILILGGAFIIIVGLLMLLGKKWEFKPWQLLYRHILEQDKKSIVIFGLIIGFLPCAPLLAIFSYIGLISKFWLQSTLYALSFGIGTSISLLILLVILAGAIPRFLMPKPEVYRIFSLICGLIIIFLGIHLIYRGI